MFDPYKPSDIQRLGRSLRASYDRLGSHRKARLSLVSDFIGDAYGTEDTGTCGAEMPVNMLTVMVDTYLMHLAGESPQVILPTAREDLLPFAADFEAIVNQELRKMRFDKILRRWVLEAMLSPIGILKCGMVDSDYIEIIPGQPQMSQEYFSEVIDFDDLVYDTEASSWDRITYIGDRYRVDYDAILASKSYDSEGKRSLEVSRSAPSDDGGRVNELGLPLYLGNSTEDGFKRSAWVWDVALPEEKLIITIADGGPDEVTSPLKVVEWDGASTTPYHAIWFMDVPGNVMPLAPGQVVKGLNRAMNALYKKMISQAKRQKTIGLFRHGETDDAQRIQSSNDGDLIPVTDPSSVKEVTYGGASQENMAFAIHTRDMFSMIAGNLDAMAGLGPQSETAKQDAMISANVSKKLARMGTCVLEATVGVVRDFMYRIWEDPINTYNATREIQGTDIQVNSQMEPGIRHGSFDDFDVQIIPFSMKHKSPNERASDILQLLTNLVIPILPMLEGQGISLNMQRTLEILGKYMSIPELQLLFEFTGQSMPGSGAEKPRMPANTHRTYERISRPGASRQGNDQIMQQLLMGGNPQQSQRAALNLPTGV